MLPIKCAFCNRDMPSSGRFGDEYYECKHKNGENKYSYSMWCHVSDNVFGDAIRFNKVRIARFIDHRDGLICQLEISHYLSNGLYNHTDIIRLDKQIDLYELAKLSTKNLLIKINRLMILC